jgi:aminoglycoside 6'-N-acetyltransferase I
MEQIIKFSDELLKQCANLYVSIFNKEPWNDEWTVETASARLKHIHNTPNSLGYVYINEEGLIGFALGYSEQWFNGVHFNLVEFCVTTSLQRKGNGTKLLQVFEKELKRKNISHINLFTSKGDIAESFYRKNDYYTDPNMIIMAKRLL